MTIALFELFPETVPLHTGVNRSTGILSTQMLEHAIARRFIEAIYPIEDSQLQPSSIDLRVSSNAYRVPAGFLPGRRRTVAQCLAELGEDVDEIDLTRTAILEQDHVYIVPLMESLRLPRRTWAKANPKSTTGRLDIFTRLIADGTEQFDRVPHGYKGGLYLEVCPKSFSVRIKEGQTLNQLRLIKGTPPPSDASLRKLHDREGLVFASDGSLIEANIAGGLTLSVDLAFASDADVVGYVARATKSAVDLSKLGHYPIDDYWKPIRRPINGQILIEPNSFYILASKEHVRVPPDYAAEMLPFDASIGEFRAHYAGFFDPGFGYGEQTGVRAVLEVKAHSVPFYLRDGQIVGKLLYEKMAERPDRIYGSKLGSSYHNQGLTLSKQFVSGTTSNVDTPAD